MKTINIKGKEYIPVVERVKEFHRLYPNGKITTEILFNDEKRVGVKATVELETKIMFKTSENGNENSTNMGKTFTGHSQAEWGKGLMGAVALEVAETSAVGRALGFAGIGIDTGIASADEMRKVKTLKDTNETDDVPF